MHVKILLFKRFYLDDGHPTRFCSLAQDLRLLWCMPWVFILESCNQYYHVENWCVNSTRIWSRLYSRSDFLFIVHSFFFSVQMLTINHLSEVVLTWFTRDKVLMKSGVCPVVLSTFIRVINSGSNIVQKYLNKCITSLLNCMNAPRVHHSPTSWQMNKILHILVYFGSLCFLTLSSSDQNRIKF